MVVSEFFLFLGIAAMNDSDVVIDTHARTQTHIHTQRGKTKFGMTW